MHCAGTSGEVYNVHKDKEVCKLLPLKLAGSQQQSFAQVDTGFDFGQGPARTHTSFIAIIVNDDCCPA